VVASGQFLIDSEASLKGIVAPAPDAAGSAPPATAAAPAASALHEAQATVDEVSAREVTLTHGPFRSLNMPGMTMAFPLANEHVAHGVRAGDKVRVLVRQSDAGLVVERIEKQGSGR